MIARLARFGVPQTDAGRRLYAMFTTGPERFESRILAALAEYISLIEQSAKDATVWTCPDCGSTSDSSDAD